MQGPPSPTLGVLMVVLKAQQTGSETWGRAGGRPPRELAGGGGQGGLLFGGSISLPTASSWAPWLWMRSKSYDSG